VAAALECPDHPEFLCRYVTLHFCCAVEQLGMVRRAAACHKRFDLCHCPHNHPSSGPDETVLILRVCIYLTRFFHRLPHPPGVLPTRTVQAATIPAAWHAYIAANLHFYTTLLACFVK
jgi:hypothetical protein